MIIRKILQINVRLKSFELCNRKLHTNLKILYFGSDKFSLNSLHKLHNEKFSKLAVVTSFKAKNNPVKIYAEKHGIECYDWPFLLQKENLPMCSNFNLGLVVSFGHLIPESIIRSFNLGMLNVHGSILPKYRGASPIIYAIKNGDDETGVSIMQIRPKKFDVGDVMAYEKVKIPKDILMPDLHDHLAEVGGNLLIKSIKNIENLQPQPQDDSKASYAPKISNEFCKIHWNSMTSTEIFNLYRSLYSFKNIFTSYKGEIVKFMEISIFDYSEFQSDELSKLKSLKTGEVTFNKRLKKLLVKCVDENFIEIKQMTMVGKKKMMTGVDFRNGFLKNYKINENVFE